MASRRNPLLVPSLETLPSKHAAIRLAASRLRREMQLRSRLCVQGLAARRAAGMSLRRCSFISRMEAVVDHWPRPTPAILALFFTGVDMVEPAGMNGPVMILQS